MNLEQWQRSKKIKAEAEAAAKRTVERVLNAVKEPAMSEFKKGDILVNKTAVNTGAIELIYEHKYYFHGFSKDFGIITIAKKKLDRYCKATEAEKQIGHRIDKPSNSRELEILDKPENHISPNCKSKDV